jgi:hypothetical protein
MKPISILVGALTLLVSSGCMVGIVGATPPNDGGGIDGGDTDAGTDAGPPLAGCVENAPCPRGYTCDGGHWSVKTADDIVEKRARIVEHVWKGQGFPSARPPDAVQVDVSPLPGSLPNVASIERLTVRMPYTSADGGSDEVVNHTYRFVPQQWNGRLALVHQGHRDIFDDSGVDVAIRHFLDRGYEVIAFLMPLYGWNTGPFATHDELKVLESPTQCLLRFYLEPIAISLNYALAQHAFTDITMLGVSGGGWSTDVYSALDPRVTYSVSVSGSVPYDLLNTGPGDEEQSHPALHALVDYRDLYVMAAGTPGRKHRHILNPLDSCCFSGTLYRGYDNPVGKVVRELGGDFRVYLDRTIPRTHAVSSHALTVPVSMLLEEPALYLLDEQDGFGYLDSSYGEASSDAGWVTLTDAGFARGSQLATPSGAPGFQWTFRHLPPGKYRVATTWPQAPGRSGAVRYSVTVNGVEQAATLVDQRREPDGGLRLDTRWQDIGAATLVDSDTLEVRLANGADGGAVADAVLVELVESGTP